MNYIYGMHTVTAWLQHCAKQCRACYIAKHTHDQKLALIIQLCHQQQIPIHHTQRSQLDTMSEHANHQGVIVATVPIDYLSEASLLQTMNQVSQPFLLILDGIQDPQNLGACIRTAMAANVTAVIFPKDKSAPINAGVHKAACGTIDFKKLCRVTNIAQFIDKIKRQGIWVYGFAAEAHNHYTATDYTGPIAIVMGGEQRGLRALTRQQCDALVTIAMPGKIASLNVASATAIALFEVVRQRC